MGWRDNRRRSICKKIMFAPEEWEQARRIHERWARNIPVYRRWGDFARQTLMHGASMNVSVTLANDPEAFKAELHHIGVNVNQTAHCALARLVDPAHRHHAPGLPAGNSAKDQPVHHWRPAMNGKSMEAWRYLGMAQMTNSSITFFRSGPVAYRAYERLGKSCRALRRRSLDAP